MSDLSNLSVVSNLLERLVVQQLLAHLNTSGLLPWSQSAYRAGHSTRTAVLKVLSDILLANDTCDLFALVLLDLAGPWTSTVFFSVHWRFLAASIIIIISLLSGAAYMQFIRYGYQQFRKSFLGQSTVTDSIEQTVPDRRCSSSSKRTVAKRRLIWPLPSSYNINVISGSVLQRFRTFLRSARCSTADDLHRSVDSESRQRLRYASSTSLIVRRTRLSTVADRAFPVAGPCVCERCATACRFRCFTSCFHQSPEDFTADRARF